MLHLHRSERADGLALALAQLLAAPLEDPFTPEVVAVPAHGMERWLTQRLSGHLGTGARGSDGICANIDFPSPYELIADAVALACGVDPDADPWRPERAVWPLLEVVQEALAEPWAAGLAAHLGHGAEEAEGARGNRRLGTVRHLAELLYRYALHRPELVAAWTRGETPPSGPASSAVWQAELWRRLRHRIGLADPAERLAEACERLRSDPALVELPRRVSVFGLTRMPTSYLRVLRALAGARDFHLFLLHPSPALWETVRIALAAVPPPRRREADRTPELVRHPLLRSWGRDVRELQLVLSDGAPTQEHQLAAEEPMGAPPTLLARVQAGIRADRPPPGAPPPGTADERAPLEADERSIAVHSCHGPARQVEVLREAILHALAADPTLEPRDVIVMCPDIEAYAPLIQATFGTPPLLEEATSLPAPSDETRTLNLRVRLADRALRQTNPVLGVVAALLELAAGRVTASQVLDLADREPVRRRFHWDDDDLARIQDWIADAGVRWGLDAAHRAPFKLAGVDSGTWAAGLDRLLLGVTMSEDGQRLYRGVLPLDDVDSGAIDLAGRLAELMARLQVALDALSRTQPLTHWAREIAAAADALTRPAPRDAWQRAQLGRILDDLVAEAGGSGTPLRLAEVRALLAERLQGRPTRANFRTGHLTICTLVPMRSVPHRVVCLLGLDDGGFPRKPPRDGDDVMLEAPQLGERDPRSEDRQLLLDALMAAGEQLILTYSGHDERTNMPLPPAVPVGELLDVLDATVRLPQGADPARTRIVIEHPLQPFDPRNFIPGALRAPGAWSFDPVALRGAESIRSERRERRPFLGAPLPPTGARAHELDELVRFVSHPVRAFLRHRLSISLFERADVIEDEMRPELGGLERWAVGQELLDALMSGIEGRDACLAAIRRGTLPPGDLGRPVLVEIYDGARTIAAAAEGLLGAPRAPVDLHVELPGGRTLTGTVPDVAGEMLLHSTYSRLAARHRIVTWVRLLALTVSDPATPYRATTLGRGSGGDIAVARIRPLADEAGRRQALATEQLLGLLDLFERGMREPLPIFCKTSAAYAAAVNQGRDGRSAALAEWETRWGFDREDREPEHTLALGGVRGLDELLAEAPAGDEHGPGWDPSQRTRLGRLACRLWDGLLEHEELA